MWEKQTEVSAPYHFDEALKRMGMNPLLHVNIAERTVTLPLTIVENNIIADVQAIGTTEKPAFIVRAEEEHLESAIFEKVSELFNWKHSMAEVQQFFSQTSLRELFQEHAGTPIIRDIDPYFCLMQCLIHQQLNLSFAHTLTERFIKNFGEEKGGIYFCPRPEIIANLSYEQLRELQFSGRKAEYVIDTSKLIASGQLNLEQLAEKSDEEVAKILLQIRGIGPWTVENFLLFGLGRPNLFPKADIGLQNALKKYFHLENKPTIDQMDEWIEEWKPYLSYASFYLWRSIE